MIDKISNKTLQDTRYVLEYYDFKVLVFFHHKSLLIDNEVQFRFRAKYVAVVKERELRCNSFSFLRNAFSLKEIFSFLNEALNVGH